MVAVASAPMMVVKNNMFWTANEGLNSFSSLFIIITGVFMVKKDVRKEMIDKRLKMTRDEVETLSSDIFNKITGSSLYKDSNTVMVYYSIKNEVDTKEILKNIIESGKRLVLPKTIKNNTLLTCLVNDINELELGSFGIMEPSITTDDRIVDLKNIDLILVPGVAFDLNGFRIGYGAGYYDRLLRDYNGIKIGICYDLQITKDAYPDIHDIRMDYLLTEKGIIKIGDE